MLGSASFGFRGMPGWLTYPPQKKKNLCKKQAFGGARLEEPIEALRWEPSSTFHSSLRILSSVLQSVSGCLYVFLL